MESAFKRGFLLKNNTSIEGQQETRKKDNNTNDKQDFSSAPNPTRSEKESERNEKLMREKEGALKPGFLLPKDYDQKRKIEDITVDNSAPDSIEKEHTTGNDEKQIKLDFWELPIEVVENIFSYLDPLSIKEVACVSRYVQLKFFMKESGCY